MISNWFIFSKDYEPSLDDRWECQEKAKLSLFQTLPVDVVVVVAVVEVLVVLVAKRIELIFVVSIDVSQHWIFAFFNTIQK